MKDKGLRLQLAKLDILSSDSWFIDEPNGSKRLKRVFDNAFCREGDYGELTQAKNEIRDHQEQIEAICEYLKIELCERKQQTIFLSRYEVRKKRKETGNGKRQTTSNKRKK